MKGNLFDVLKDLSRKWKKIGMFKYQKYVVTNYKNTK